MQATWRLVTTAYTTVQLYAHSSIQTGKGRCYGGHHVQVPWDQSWERALAVVGGLPRRADGSAGSAELAGVIVGSVVEMVGGNDVRGFGTRAGVSLTLCGVVPTSS